MKYKADEAAKCLASHEGIDDDGIETAFDVSCVCVCVCVCACVMSTLIASYVYVKLDAISCAVKHMASYSL